MLFYYDIEDGGVNIGRLSGRLTRSKRSAVYVYAMKIELRGDDLISWRHLWTCHTPKRVLERQEANAQASFVPKTSDRWLAKTTDK